MNGKKIIVSFVIVILGLISFTPNSTSQMYFYEQQDTIKDVAYFEGSDFIKFDDFKPEIDIVSVRVNESHAVMTVREEPTEHDNGFNVFILWHDNLDYIEGFSTHNNTYCHMSLFPSMEGTYAWGNIITELYNSTGDEIYFNQIHEVTVIGKEIFWPLNIHLAPIANLSAPVKVFGQTYSADYSNDVPQYWRDYCPNEGQPSYTFTARINGIIIVVSSIMVITLYYSKKKIKRKLNFSLFND